MKKLLVLCSILASLTITAHAEEVRFESPTYRNVQDFLMKDGFGDEIKGDLSLPSIGKGKLSAVVLLHTCSGPGVTEKTISEHLLAEGFATLTFNNQTPRGWTPDEVCGGKIVGGTTNWTQLGDAYAALSLLAKDPRIDPSRIAVVGASQGGGHGIFGLF